jgi:hypothetical protein
MTGKAAGIFKVRAANADVQPQFTLPVLYKKESPG